MDYLFAKLMADREVKTTCLKTIFILAKMYNIIQKLLYYYKNITVWIYHCSFSNQKQKKLTKT